MRHRLAKLWAQIDHHCTRGMVRGKGNDNAFDIAAAMAVYMAEQNRRKL